MPPFDAVDVTLALPLWAAGAFLVLLIAMSIIALRRSATPGSVAALFGIPTLVIIAWAAWIYVDQSMLLQRAAERQALDARAAQLTVAAAAPGSALACLDAIAGPEVEAFCERALFVSPEAVAAAAAYVEARLRLLADGLDYARRADRNYLLSLAGLRRSIEADRFGLVAHVLATRHGCPSVLWYAFVRAITGDFFHFEMAQGEVVWMAEAWAKGATLLFSKWLSHAWHLIAFVPAQAIPLAALAALGAWALRRSRDTGTALRFARPIMAAGIYVSAAALGFYTCVGWLVWRLAYPMLPPLLVAATAAVLVISRRLDDRDRRRVAAIAVALAGAQIVYEIGKNGPWS